jgi:hypothetical protein
MLVAFAVLAAGLPAAAAPTQVSFRIVGLGHSIPDTTAPCHEGQWSTGLYASSRPVRIGTAYGCGLTISKSNDQAGDLRWIKQQARVTYILPGGTIRTIETQRFDFMKHQHHSHASAHGRIVKGTGRYAQLQGTVRVDGNAVDGRAAYRVQISPG